MADVYCVAQGGSIPSIWRVSSLTALLSYTAIRGDASLQSDEQRERHQRGRVEFCVHEHPLARIVALLVSASA